MSYRDWSQEVQLEFIDFMLGDKIDRGMSRVVYDHPFDPKLVIKVEDSVVHFQNVREWEVWQQAQHYPKQAKWLAPCHYISHSGTFLIQSKALDLRPGETPKLLPKFLMDHKVSNFGLYEGRVVCRDYGTLLFQDNLRLVKWCG